jgi:type IV pilus assembly protein PilV
MYMTSAQNRAPSAGRCRSVAHRSRGFSLVEVMVALVVCSIGLLGLAKMESLALSSTGVANARSLAALQASSLAAAMHANPGYWQAGFAPAITTVNAATATTAVPACLTAGATSCAPAAMAAYDLQQWAISLQALLPGFLATITCSTTGFPVTCTIQIQWVENAVAANSLQTNITLLQQPTYTLYVQP